jgi:hypothetical protein
VAARGEHAVSLIQQLVPILTAIWLWFERRAPKFRLVFWGKPEAADLHLGPRSLILLEEGDGAGEYPDMLGDSARHHPEEDQCTGRRIGCCDLRHHRPRPVGQHLARADLAPIAAVRRDRERLPPDDLAPDAASEAKAIAAHPAQAGLQTPARARITLWPPVWPGIFAATAITAPEPPRHATKASQPRQEPYFIEERRMATGNDT